MKTIKMTASNKNKLADMKEGKESFDKLVNRLIDDVSDDLPVVTLDDRVTNINVDESTLEKLDSFALTKGEPYENILLRMMLLHKQ